MQMPYYHTHICLGLRSGFFTDHSSFSKSSLADSVFMYLAFYTRALSCWDMVNKNLTATSYKYILDKCVVLNLMQQLWKGSHMGVITRNP